MVFLGMMNHCAAQFDPETKGVMGALFSLTMTYNHTRCHVHVSEGKSGLNHGIDGGHDPNLWGFEWGMIKHQLLR